MTESPFRKAATWVLIAALVLATPLVAAGCTDNRAAESSPAAESTAITSETGEAVQRAARNSSGPASQAGEEPIMVEITMENGGVIKLELDHEAAPITVDNFVELVNDEFYDGLIFHRVISGFMVQGGDPTGTGSGGPGHQIKGEFSSNGWDNPISHKRGVISMARSQNPDSAGSQFFITHGDASFLDGDYAAFGTVVEGMDVVDEIAAVPTDAGDRPLDDVVIKTIRVVE